MSDELETHEQRLADLFSQVSAPPSMRRWESGAVGRAGRWWLRPLRALVSVGGETRLRPLAAALVLPVTVLAVAGGLQIHTHFGGAAGQGGDPPARTAAAMAYDAAHHQVVMFGGTTGPGAGTELSDTWTWDGSSWTQQHPAVNPGAREGATMAFDAAHNEVVLYGGSEYRPTGGSGPVNDTWAWDGSNWHRVVTAHTPAATDTAGLAYDSQRSQLLLVVERVEYSFGGGAGFASGSGSAAPGSLHGIAVPVPHPVLMPTPAATTGSTGGSAANVFGTISGGLTQSGTAGAAASHAGAVPMPAEPQGTSLVPHGPPVQLNPTLDTWTFTGSDWQRLSPRSVPSGTFQLAMPAFDATAKHLVLLASDMAPLQTQRQCVATSVVGGSGVAPPPTLAPSFPPGLPILAPSARPLPPLSVPPLIAPAPVCAAATQGDVARSLAVGGRVEWDWDGNNWNRLPAPNKGALAPFGVRLTSDPTSGRLLAVGALSTWTWTGSTWKLQQNPGGLARRTGFALAGDPDTNQVVLFGGRIAGIAGSDTWTWDGKKWTHRSGTTPPLPTPYVPPVAQGGTLGPPCYQDVRSFKLPDGTVQITVILPSPTGKAISDCVVPSGVSVTLLDGSRNKVAVIGNGFAMGNLPTVELSWMNWCGPEKVTSVLVKGIGIDVNKGLSVSPNCTDAHGPSTLMLVPPAHAIP